MEMQYLCD